VGEKKHWVTPTIVKQQGGSSYAKILDAMKLTCDAVLLRRDNKNQKVALQPLIERRLSKSYNPKNLLKAL
jgi:hypothetical protein